MTQSSPTVVEAANAALGPIEMAVRELLDGVELEAVLAVIHHSRGEAIARLEAGEALGQESRQVAFLAADGCYETWEYDLNDLLISRRRYYAPR